MARKPGLGRGLDALFADAAPINEEEYKETNGAGSAEETAAAALIEGLSSDAGALAEDATADERGAGEPVNEDKGRSVRKTAASRKRKPAAADRTEDDPEKSDRVHYIDINDIRPNSAQPRLNFDEGKLNELASSIKTNGVIQPLIVRQKENGYELVAGERRWRASRIAGLRKIPCIIRDFDDSQNAIVAIIENMQREDLNPIEEALGLRSMTEKYGFTQEQVSASLGRSRTYITNSIRLLKLPEEIQQYVSSGQMSAAHGRTIINIPDKVKQKEVADKIIRNDLSVRATEKLAERVKDELRPERKRRRPAGGGKAAKSDEVNAVEQELMSLLGTRVSINGDNKGRIELEYYSIEELNRLIDILREAFR